MCGLFDNSGRRWPRLKPLPCEKPDAARTSNPCAAPPNYQPFTYRHLRYRVADYSAPRKM